MLHCKPRLITSIFQLVGFVCFGSIVNGVITGPTMNTTDWSDLGTVAAIAFDGGACSHARAPVLYYESINDQDCNMTSYECSDYDKVRDWVNISPESNGRVFKTDTSIDRFLLIVPGW